jgi:ABC-2 type transport system permease protein
MQANSNAITLTALPGASDARRWGRAFYGAWQADWRERRRDWRVWLVVGLGLLLAACAGVQTALQRHDTQQARQVAAQAEARRWLQQGEKNPHSAAHYGVYVFKPLPTLAALDPGVERYVGSAVWLEAHKQNELVYRPAADEPGASRQFRLTPALLLQVLAPVAMIFLGFAMYAGERERGTLAALRVNAAPLGAIGAARALVLVCLAALIAVPACAAVALIGGEGGQPFSDATLRAALFALGYLLYLLSWAGLITAVSAWAPDMRASLGTLIALWALLALVLPRAAVELAQAVAPLPTMQHFRQQLDTELGAPHDPGDDARDQLQLMRQYGVSDVAALPVNWSGINLARGEERGNRIFDRHYGALYGKLERQSAAAALAGWLSPTVAVAGLSSHLAASDTSGHLAFVQGAERQRRIIQGVLNDAITRHPDHHGRRYDGDERLWRSVPPFRFTFAPLRWQGVISQFMPLLTMLGASVLLAMLGVRRLRRGSIR